MKGIFLQAQLFMFFLSVFSVAKGQHAYYKEEIELTEIRIKERDTSKTKFTSFFNENGDKFLELIEMGDSMVDVKMNVNLKWTHLILDEHYEKGGFDYSTVHLINDSLKKVFITSAEKGDTIIEEYWRNDTLISIYDSENIKNKTGHYSVFKGLKVLETGRLEVFDSIVFNPSIKYSYDNKGCLIRREMMSNDSYFKYENDDFCNRKKSFSVSEGTESLFETCEFVIDGQGNWTYKKCENSGREISIKHRKLYYLN